MTLPIQVPGLVSVPDAVVWKHLYAFLRYRYFRIAVSSATNIFIPYTMVSKIQHSPMWITTKSHRIIVIAANMLLHMHTGREVDEVMELIK